MDCQPEISTFPDNTNKLCILRLNFHVFTKFLFPFYIDLGSNYVIMKPSQLERVFPKQDTATAGSPAKAIRTAGSNAEDRNERFGNFCCLID